MEKFRLFKGKEEYKLRIDELVNRHKINVQRATNLFQDSIVDERTKKIVTEGEKVFMDVGFTIRDVAWQAALNKEGIDWNTQKRLWEHMRNASDQLRDKFRGEGK